VPSVTDEGFLQSSVNIVNLLLTVAPDDSVWTLELIYLSSSMRYTKSIVNRLSLLKNTQISAVAKLRFYQAYLEWHL